MGTGLNERSAFEIDQPFWDREFRVEADTDPDLLPAAEAANESERYEIAASGFLVMGFVRSTILEEVQWIRTYLVEITPLKPLHVGSQITVRCTVIERTPAVLLDISVEDEAGVLMANGRCTITIPQ